VGTGEVRAVLFRGASVLCVLFLVDIVIYSR
jgi:hypothetical protein